MASRDEISNRIDSALENSVSSRGVAITEAKKKAVKDSINKAIENPISSRANSIEARGNTIKRGHDSVAGSIGARGHAIDGGNAEKAKRAVLKKARDAVSSRANAVEGRGMSVERGASKTAKSRKTD